MPLAVEDEAVIRIHARGHADHLPVAGAEVLAEAVGGGVTRWRGQGRTDDGGGCVFAMAYPLLSSAAALVVLVRSDRHATALEEVRGPFAEKEHHVDVELAAGGAIRGRLVDETGHGLSGAMATISVTENRPPDGVRGELLESRSTRTSIDGGFRFDQLPAGTYRLTVAIDGHHVGGPVPIEVVDGGLDELYLLAQPVRTAGLRVREAGSLITEEVDLGINRSARSQGGSGWSLVRDGSASPPQACDGQTEGVRFLRFVKTLPRNTGALDSLADAAETWRHAGGGSPDATEITVGRLGVAPRTVTLRLTSLGETPHVTDVDLSGDRPLRRLEVRTPFLECWERPDLPVSVSIEDRTDGSPTRGSISYRRVAPGVGWLTLPSGIYAINEGHVTAHTQKVPIESVAVDLRNGDGSIEIAPRAGTVRVAVRPTGIGGEGIDRFWVKTATDGRSEFRLASKGVDGEAVLWLRPGRGKIMLLAGGYWCERLELDVPAGPTGIELAPVLPLDTRR